MSSTAARRLDRATADRPVERPELPRRRLPQRRPHRGHGRRTRSTSPTSSARTCCRRSPRRSASRRARDGSHAQLGPPTYNPAGPGENTVVLVDNVRDSNFYDLNNTQGNSYIAGFFSSQLNNFFDRNVMTHRRVRLAASHAREPAARAGSGEQLHERAGAAVPVRGRLRARVPAPAHELRRPGRRGQLDQRGPLRLGADADRLRESRRRRSRRSASTRTCSASSAG